MKFKKGKENTLNKHFISETSMKSKISFFFLTQIDFLSWVPLFLFQKDVY